MSDGSRLEQVLVGRSDGEQISRMSALEGLARSLMVGSVPIAALAELGSEMAVSLAFAFGSGASIVGVLWIDRSERRIGRAAVLNLGLVALIASALLFGFGPPWTIPIAIFLRALHSSVFSICTALYVMEYVEKSAIVAVESRRITYSALTWLIGPTTGAALWSGVGHVAPFLACAAVSVVLWLFHWRMRYADRPVRATPEPPSNPFAAVPRFFSQRYLRMAYLITLFRAMFWAVVFVYGPLYVIDAGLPVWAAGAFLSTASAMLFASPLVLRASRRFGVRTMIIVGFGLIVVCLLGLTVLGEPRRVGVLLWLLGSVGGGVLDVLGNIPFMRLVRPRERTPMTAVFTTWREMSFLLAPLLAAGVLLVGPLWLLYPVLAVLMLGGIGAASVLPRRI